MLNVSYKNRIGYYTDKSYGSMSKPKKVYIYHANALCAFIRFSERKTDENGKEKIATLEGFLADTGHLKNWLNDDKEWFTEMTSNWTFYAEEMNNDLWKAVKMLANAGVSVTIKSNNKGLK